MQGAGAEQRRAEKDGGRASVGHSEIEEYRSSNVIVCPETAIVKDWRGKESFRERARPVDGEFNLLVMVEIRMPLVQLSTSVFADRSRAGQ